ncbi:hypothetical protein RM553_13735 [Zunongwangia sp. F363]|uniref:Uncharacterized protein n=1 Tax=Autumnicola tepida TaxID=3075595 RepID=A0ABU3CC27_9FLAO|nr:hypothetical protein [Zunongwangia sp. F363]MDT0643895.1 hypothetical protein [Zunongwangia sp. F363]
MDKEIDIKELEKRWEVIKNADKDRPRKEFQDATQKKEDQEIKRKAESDKVKSERESDVDFQDLKREEDNR